MLKALIKFINALTSNKHPGEIAHAFCLAMILGFMPKNNLLWYILTILFLFMRIQRGCLVIFTFLFALLAPVLDNLFDTIGYAIITYQPLESIFSTLLNIPFVAFTKINNSIVMGSLAFSLMAYIPVYIIARIFVKYWRKFLAPVVRKTKIMVFLSKLPLVQKIGEMI